MTQCVCEILPLDYGPRVWTRQEIYVVQEVVKGHWGNTSRVKDIQRVSKKIGACGNAPF